MTTFTVNRKSSQRQPKRHDRSAIRRHWTARLELLRRLPGLQDPEIRERSIWAIHSRDQHQANVTLDAVIANQEREEDDELPVDPDVPQHSFPELGHEPFNAPPEDLIDAWKEPSGA